MNFSILGQNEEKKQKKINFREKNLPIFLCGIKFLQNYSIVYTFILLLLTYNTQYVIKSCRKQRLRNC